MFLSLGAFVFSKQLLSSRNSNKAMARSPGEMKPEREREMEMEKERDGERETDREREREREREGK